MINGNDEQNLEYLLDPCFQIVNTHGAPLTSGWLEVYIHGTRTKYYCASDFDGTLHPFKIPLDSLGSNIVLADPNQAYDVYVYNKYGTLQMSRYNVKPGSGGSGSGQIVIDDKPISRIQVISNTLDGPDWVGTPWKYALTEVVGDKLTWRQDGEDMNLGNVYAKAGTYHYDFIVKVDWTGELRNEIVRFQILGINPNDRDTWHSFDLSYPHTEFYHFSSFSNRMAGWEDRIFVDLDISPYGGAPEGLTATVETLTIFSIEDSVSVHTGLDKVHHDETMTGDGTSSNPLSIQDAMDSLQDTIDDKQDKLIAGTNITIDANNVISATGGGSSYTAGSGIEINNDVISTDIEVQNAQKVSVNLDFGNTIQTVNSITTDGSTVRTDGFNFTLPTIKAGEGISFSKVETETTISMDSDVGDVVGTVEKLKKDIDTQITTNFDMPNISQVYDFADGNNWMTHNGACMLYQAFTIPINHELRTTDDDADTPTLLGIYAQQNFAHKIMLAIYEYTYPAEGEGNGSSTYVGDTGPITVLKGMNEFPLKNRNPSITELRSDKVYYASLYLPSDAFVSGLYLAGCPGYGNASIPAEPRLTCATENITWNGAELDLDDPTTTLNLYQVIQIPGQDPYYQYFIGPWVGGYNERWSSPRFYMQIRNGEFNIPVVPTVPFETLGDSKLPHGGILASDLPNFSSSTANSGFRDVTPLTNVTITAFEWIDSKPTAGGWEAGNCVFNSDYSTNLSGNSNTVTNLGEVYHNESYTAYAHRITFTTPITLTAGTTYRFLCSSWSSSSDWIWSWTDPTDVFDATNNGWYVDWSQNVSRYSHIAGQYNKLYDSQNNHYVI